MANLILAGCAFIEPESRTATRGFRVVVEE